MVSNPVRMGLIGRAGSGKTTVAEFVQDSYDCERLSFAERLKEIARVKDTVGSHEQRNVLYQMAWNLQVHAERTHSIRRSYSLELAAAWVKDFEESTSRRELLQRLGTDSGRRIDPELWIRPVRSKLEDSPNAPFVLDDVRFVNEAEMLKEFGFVIAHVYVPRLVRLRRLEERDGSVPEGTNWENHPSEFEMHDIECDYSIDNSLSDDGKLARSYVQRIVGKEFAPVVKIQADTTNLEQDLDYIQYKYTISLDSPSETDIVMPSMMVGVSAQNESDEEPTLLTPESLFEDTFMALHGTPLQRFQVEAERVEDGRMDYVIFITTAGEDGSDE